jgi:hypothetical protein
MGRAAGVVIVTAILAVLAPGRFGGHEAATDGPLRWEARARVSSLAGAPGGHLLFGRVVNHGDRPVRLRAAKVRVLDDDGHALRTTAAFADGYVPEVTLRGYGTELYGSGTGVGREVVLRTGQAAPLTLSYTADDGARASAVDYGGGRLKLGQ